ncbi:hypothetical protein K492DRAFT_206820 [Lichtheimia hyalospora FSU 10163]|nr:hypothetical protein K492DRAFT_206820 [Lichtheimia hyalospora FSU 10163]
MAPTKKSAQSKAASSNKKSPHPTYEEMIKAAIIELKERKGSSRQALKKYLLANYDLTANSHFDSQFNAAIKRGVNKGVFSQPKGSSGTVKLVKPEKSTSTSTSKKDTKAAPVTKKTTAASKTKKTVTPTKKAATKKATTAAAKKKAATVKKAATAAASKKKTTPTKKAAPTKKASTTAKSNVKAPAKKKAGTRSTPSRAAKKA